MGEGGGWGDLGGIWVRGRPSRSPVETGGPRHHRQAYASAGRGARLQKFTPTGAPPRFLNAQTLIHFPSTVRAETYSPQSSVATTLTRECLGKGSPTLWPPYGAEYPGQLEQRTVAT